MSNCFSMFFMRFFSMSSLSLHLLVIFFIHFILPLNVLNLGIVERVSLSNFSSMMIFSFLILVGVFSILILVGELSVCSLSVCMIFVLSSWFFLFRKISLSLVVTIVNSLPFIIDVEVFLKFKILVHLFEVG